MTYNLISVWIQNVTDGFAGSMYICRQENDSLSGNTDQNEPMKQAEIAIAESLTFSSQNAINFKDKW